MYVVCAVVSHYMRQLLEAVSYCHNHAIIHRNLQPQFVVMATASNSSPIKLTGFSASLQLGLSDCVHAGQASLLRFCNIIAFVKDINFYSCI